MPNKPRCLLRLIAAVLITAAFALPLYACTAKEDGFVFGTFYSLDLKGKGAEKAKKDIRRMLTAMENTLSVSVPASDLAKINAANAGEEIAVSADTVQLFELSKFFYQKTTSFNPAIFPLVELWRFSPDTFTGIASSIPSESEIAALLPLCGFDTFLIDTQTAAVKKNLSQAKLDFGAIAKGYAADMAFHVAKDTDCFVNIGGTLRTNRRITVAVASPRGEGYYAKFTLDNMSCATSGDYERYYIYEGKRYHHIIGKNGYPAGITDENPIVGVTVVGELAAYCDALSTIVMIEGEAAAPLLLELGYSALVITKTGYYILGDADFEIL